MQEPASPSAVDNAFRVAALARTTALDAPSDPVLDALSRAAARAVDAPTAMVSLVSAERQAFAGATGLPATLVETRGTPISQSLCARVVDSHEPLLIDDARSDVALRGHPFVEEHGAVAYLGVPLVGEHGEAYGAVCAVDSSERSWSCDDVRQLERVAAETAAELDRRRAAEQAQRRASTLQVQAELLTAIANGAPQAEVLDLVVRRLQYERPDMIASILLVDETGRLRPGSAPDLPVAYTALVDGLEVGPQVGSCGTAAHRGETVIVEDVETDPLWADYREVALAYGLRSCWSVPILATDGRVLASFAMYHATPARPTEDDWALLEHARQLTSIAVEQTWSRDRLRTSEARHRVMVETIVDGVITVDAGGTILAVNPAVERMFGYGSNELLGQPLTILIPQRHQAGHGRGLARAGAAPAYAPSQELRAEGLRRDGSEFPISVAVGRAEEADGRRTFTAILKDVTHQVAIEDELRRSEQAQRQLAEQQMSLAAEHAALHRVATAVASESEPARVCELVAEEVAQLLSLECATVSRFVREDEVLVMGRWAAPTSFAPTPGTRIVLTPEEMARIARGGGGAAVIDMEPRAALPYRHHVAAPITVGGRHWGIVRAATNSPEGIDPRATARLESFAELTQTAIANAEARAALNAQASTDPLTGLPNHRTFHDSLRDAVALAGLAHAPLALVLFDLDRFKAVNDTHGHRAGDRVLVETARRLEQHADDGALGRVGGEEFALLLPGARRGGRAGAGRARAGARRRRAVRRPRAADDLRRHLRPGLRRHRGAALRAGRRRALLGQGARPQRVRAVLAGPGRGALGRRARRPPRAPPGPHRACGCWRAPWTPRTRSTQRHSERVADLAARIAAALGWTPDHVELLRDAGLVHDVGKIGIPDSILLKPGRLDPQEYAADQGARRPRRPHGGRRAAARAGRVGPPPPRAHRRPRLPGRALRRRRSRRARASSGSPTRGT